MESLETLLSAVENAEPVRQFVEMAFPYLSEAVRARMPRYLAWYLLVAAICLVMSIVARRRRGESLSQGLGCAAITGIAAAFAIGSALFSFEDPLRNLISLLGDLTTIPASATAHITSLEPLGLASDVVNVALLVIAAIFWGALAAIPILSLLLALRAEASVYGFAAPVALVGHSLFCLPIIAIVMAVFGLIHAAFLIAAFPIGLLAVIVMGSLLRQD